MEFVVHLEWIGKYSISVEFQSAGGWFTVRRYHPSSGWIHVSRSAGEEARHRHNFPAYCKPKLVRCFGTNKDGGQCQRMTRRPGGACSWHSHQKRP